MVDEEALEAFHKLCRLEGIIPALESCHALAYAAKIVFPPDVTPAQVDEQIFLARQTNLDFVVFGTSSITYLHSYLFLSLNN